MPKSAAASTPTTAALMARSVAEGDVATPDPPDGVLVTGRVVGATAAVVGAAVVGAEVFGGAVVVGAAVGGAVDAGSVAAGQREGGQLDVVDDESAQEPTRLAPPQRGGRDPTLGIDDGERCADRDRLIARAERCPVRGDRRATGVVRLEDHRRPAVSGALDPTQIVAAL